MMKNKIFTYLLLGAMVLSVVLAVGPAPATASGHNVDFYLTILHNNDGESDLLPEEVFEGEDLIGYEKGVAYFAKVLSDARTAANIKPEGDNTDRGSIFVSSGDNFLASPSFTASLADGTFYDAMALDSLGYDAIILGNHDFDFGPDMLADFISYGFARPGKPPYLSANLDFSGEPTLQALVDQGVIAGSTVVNVKGEEVGIVGATTENLPFISSPRDVVVNAVLPAAQAAIDDLEESGVDKIIFVSHLQDIDGDIALAEQLSGVDVMVAGGGDELLANPDDPLLPSDEPGDIFGPYPMSAINADGSDVPVVTTSGQYGYVGNLVVGFDDEGNVVVVDEEASKPLRVVSESIGNDGVKPNGSFNARVVAPVAAFVAKLESNVIGTSAFDLDGRRSSVRSMETNEGNLIADALFWQATQLAAEYGVNPPDVALQNGGGIRNDDIIPAGNITEKDTFDMVPFANFVTVLENIPRSQFKEIMENTVSRTQPGDTPGGTGRFAQIAGFTMIWSGSGTAQVLNPDGTVATPGTRVMEVVLNDETVIVTGGSVVSGPDLTVATIDFLARGGDEYPYRGAPFTVLGASYQQALANYIVDGLGGTIDGADYEFDVNLRNFETP
jgi:5'-nucleotidase